MRRLLAAGLALGLVLAARGAAPDPPLYEGKTLKDWVKALKAANTHEQAVAALSGAGADAVPELITALKMSDPLTRIGAATALGQIGVDAKAAVPIMKELLHDKRP